jgi:Xaa-Pro aminopeptidase
MWRRIILDYGNFIQFEPVTLVPFEPKLINFSRLSRDQMDWLNMYNAEVLDKVGSRLVQHMPPHHHSPCTPDCTVCTQRTLGL